MLAMALSCRRGRITQGLALMYDMKNLSRISHLEANASKGMDAFWQFDRAAFEDGTERKSMMLKFDMCFKNLTEVYKRSCS